MRLLHRAPVAAGVFAAAFAFLTLMAGGCTKSAEDAKTGSAPSTAAPLTPPAVQSQITAQQQAESAERAAHAPPGPK